MIYGYARVSTLGQAKGNSLEEQERVLKQNGAEVIFQDSFTGTKADRPEFKKLLEILKSGDTLVVSKLDRFARNTVDGITIVQELLKNDIRVHILSMGLVDNTTTGKLILTVMLAFAEFERDMIVQRTQEGKVIAKTKEDFTEGRPKKYTKAQLDHAMKLLDEYSYNKVSELTGISKSTLIREKRNR